MGSDSVYESLRNTPGIVTVDEVGDMNELRIMMPQNGADFLKMMMDEGGRNCIITAAIYHNGVWR